MDVICQADHIIDLGPDGGDGGGTVVAEGSPEELADCEASWTGRYVGEMLARMRKREGEATSL